MKKRLLLLSFIEGAAVMAAELCGAKLLAPIFGSSLFVWASVMGITLAALAGGYFFGGYITQKKRDRGKLLFQLLNLAALCVLIMPLFGHYLVPRISYLPFLAGLVLSTLVLIFFPVFFLGATSPVFIAVQSLKTGDEGKVSGTVYAVSTVGGILATFLCGFYLIPQIGLDLCLLVFGGVLFVTNLFVFKLFKTTNLFLLAALIYLNLQFKLNSKSWLYNEDGLYGNLKVEDLHLTDSTNVRYLEINSIPQTEMDLRTKKSVSAYLNLLDSLIPVSKNKRALTIGLGGGLLANVLIRKNYQTEAVELDERVINVAKQFFYLDKRVRVFHQDGRYFLNRCKTVYDVIVIDIYKGEELPGHVLTMESLAAIKQNLSADGKMYVNWHGYLQGEIGMGTCILYNTFARSGFDVKLCAVSNDEAHRNLVFVAGLNTSEPLPFELTELPQKTELVNTDNKPLLEKYNILATKAWRTNYLRYYQGAAN